MKDFSQHVKQEICSRACAALAKAPALSISVPLDVSDIGPGDEDWEEVDCANTHLVMHHKAAILDLQIFDK